MSPACAVSKILWIFCQPARMRSMDKTAYYKTCIIIPAILATVAIGYSCHLVKLTPTLWPSSSLYPTNLSLFFCRRVTELSCDQCVVGWRVRLQASSHYHAPILERRVKGKSRHTSFTFLPTYSGVFGLRPSLGHHGMQGKRCTPDEGVSWNVV